MREIQLYRSFQRSFLHDKWIKNPGLVQMVNELLMLYDYEVFM